MESMNWVDFEKRKVFNVALIALSITFIFTLMYSTSTRDCGGVPCSPELNVGRFHFTTPLLILLVVQIIGIIGLVIALILTRKGEHQGDAFASLANNSPMFKLQQNTNNASPF